MYKEGRVEESRERKRKILAKVENAKVGNWRRTQ
jgi:hypothetical protein